VLVSVERGGQLGKVVAPDDEPAIAAVTAAELLVGAELAAGRQRAARRRFVEGLLERVAVEPYDLAVARVHAELLAHVRRTGAPRGAHDLIVAATARARGCVVVTLDRRGFDVLPGVRVVAP
jgi:tRNA(fMet)-specific endonuclease VapC